MKISKKIRLLFSLTSLLVCFCFACITVNADSIDLDAVESETSEDDTVLYADGKLSLTDAESLVDTYVQQLTQYAVLSSEELDYLGEYYGSQTDFFANLATVSGEDGLGTYESYDDVEVVETDEKSVVNVSAMIHFDKTDVKMTLNVKCFDTMGPVVTSTSFSLADEAEESLIESLKGAGLNTVVGMGTVFVVLIFISLIISCFNFIPKIQAMFSKKENETTVEEKTVASTIKETVVTEDSEIIAVIAAAIAASENTTTDSFVVRSIRKR